MREGWRMLPLADLLSPRREMLPVASMRSVPYAGVRWYGLGIYSRSEVEGSSVKARELTVIHTGQVTYNRMWATKGAFGVAGPDVDGCVVTNDFPVFDVMPAVLPSYLSLLFVTPAFRSAAASLAVGTTERRRLLERDFLPLVIEVPPLAEQRRIIDLIGTVDTVARRGEKLVQAADAAYQALLSEAFASTEARVSLGDVCEITVGPAFASEHFTSAPDSTRLLRGINLTPGATRWDEAVSWPDEDAARLSRYCLRRDDVVVAMDRAFTMEGELRTARIDEDDLPALLVQRVARLRLRSEMLTQGLVYHLLRSRVVGSLLADSQTPGGYVPHLSAGDFARCKVPALSRRDAGPLEALLDSASRVVRRSRALAAALTSARSVLVADLLSGDHEIPASYDRFLDGAA